MDQSLRFDVENHRLICCICCEWVNVSDVAVDAFGTTWDMCKPCGELEGVAAVFRIMAGQ